MFFKRCMKKTPYIGNMVKTSYLVVNQIGPHLNKVMPCWSVRIDPENQMPGLILSNSDLTEAHFRFIKYADHLTSDEEKRRLGSFQKRTFITKRAGARPVELMLVYLQSEGGPRTGYLFAQNDMARIVEKTKKIMATIKKPSFFQKILIKLNILLGKLHKE